MESVVNLVNRHPELKANELIRQKEAELEKIYEEIRRLKGEVGLF